MHGYERIYLPHSACIHFVRDVGAADSLSSIFQKVAEKSIECAYIDCAQIDISASGLVNAIAAELRLAYAPYSFNLWAQFVDDLIKRSFASQGIVIVVDNADVLLGKDRDQMFDLIEIFLVQFHHWFEKKKPCHLCFQMENSPALKEFFATYRLRQSRPIA